MENETLNQEEVQVEQKGSLYQVTPLSKYLAMTLFIILPFLGGWVGYMYAPEKVIEKERVVLEEKPMDWSRYSYVPLGIGHPVNKEEYDPKKTLH